ncbi:MAG: hypothetical protein AAF557_14410 [Pseudomonadota bacterium]
MAVLCLVLCAGSASAQISQEDLAPTGPRDEAVTDSMSWERVDDDLIYLRPSAPFNPDGNLEIELPEKPKTEQEQNSSSRFRGFVIFGAILVAIIALFIWQGSRIQVGFGRRSEGNRQTSRTRADEETDVINSDLAGFLDRLAAMADRREALILLVNRALERAAHANSMTLGRAQTGRDVIRALPGAWRYRDTLRDLVRQAEIVHFGGRDISEDRWQECLSAAQPLFRGAHD